jgi:subtilisin family serine protease
MDEATIKIDDGGVLARWADWRARGIGTPVSAIGREDSPSMAFVADEILVDRHDRRLIDEIARLGAEVVPERPLLPPPPGLRPRELSGDFPTPIRMRFSSRPRVEGTVRTLTSLVRQHDAARGEMTFTSEAAASLACIVAQHAAEGRKIGLNTIGTPAELPFATAIEGDGTDACTWPEYAGRTRIAEAWQLVESRRAAASVEPLVWVAILDSGFWLDPAGVPLGQPSDFGLGVVQVNLLDEGANASGTNPIPGVGGQGSPWHGNKVASAAVAAVGNGIGAAGAGGTVGRPVFFRSRFTDDEVLRCLKYCTAWGLDILNMSFTIHVESEFFFGTSAWNDAFNFAIAHGVVPIAAAGNEGRELPDFNARPATRTPGAITVAAHNLDQSAWSGSNYGSSVTIWAPQPVWVMADGDSPGALTQAGGTSLAAPLVAGVAAMMRAVNPMLDALAIRNLIAQTGWPGTGRVSRGLDAYAAVLAAMGNSLPDFLEPNTRETAGLLTTIAPGTLGPYGGRATRSGLGDDDWWRFTVQEFTDATITVEYYARLGACVVELHPDAPDSNVLEELEDTQVPGKRTLTALLPPGTYRIRIAGNRPSLYELKVRTKPATLKRDGFEVNDSFETAAPLLFKPRKGPYFVAREWGPGSFRATLHRTFHFITGVSTVNDDYFRFDVPGNMALSIPTIRIYNADFPIVVELFNDSHVLVKQWPASREPIDIVPPEETTCFLKVSGATATRYRISVGLEVDKDALPEPHQRQFEIFPPWWIDDPLRIVERVTDYYVNIGSERALGDRLSFEQSAQPIGIELLDVNGNVVRRAAPSENGSLDIDIRDVPQGGYLVRVTRPETGRGINVRLRPPIG